ncbi:hypothetical protein JK358_33055 [Nocardia sp. 2]|uniref:Uncharacterized protein n=1 Tax=Nocardia acididurans TaxID=2802282 RepID=A0ABS1MF21_9NOCA|nr:hypothetical protein [Nocardia acididurans]MBL1079246.1 hypothetical protein [Nocardia acididurans]
MTEDQVQQRKKFVLGGFAALGGFAVLLFAFAVLGVEPSGITSALSGAFLIGAASCFGSAARITRDARR